MKQILEQVILMIQEKVLKIKIEIEIMKVMKKNCVYRNKIEKVGI